MATTGSANPADRTYPFAGIVGMADLKLALLLNAVSPAIGGVLVRGEKGTAKSTMVRGLAALLPPVRVVSGCPYSCDPAAPDPGCPAGPHDGTHDGPNDGSASRERPVTLAELPVGATEDRLAGSLDIERVLTAGTTAFQPGLLAAAHRGVLYVDEVNLLHDHLVDLLLDAAALGVNYVEREGVSVRHASRFLLVGTMNPEEGELRPQLLDRFGLTVQATASQDPAERAEVVRRRLAFEADPAGFVTRFSAGTAALASQVAAARERLPQVSLPDAALRQICSVCGAFGVDGMRADLVTARTAIALAAWAGRDEVTEEDIRTAARLALPHRRRRDPFDAPGLDEQALDDALREAAAQEPAAGAPEAGDPEAGAPEAGDPEDPDHGPEDPDDDPRGPDGPGGLPEHTESSAAPPSQAPSAGTYAPLGTQSPPGAPVPPTAPFRARLLTVPGVGEGAPGRRSAARGPFGRTVGARVPPSRPFALHLPATVRAAALRGSRPSPAMIVGRNGRITPETAHDHDLARPGGTRLGAGRRVAVGPGDLREAVREGREGNLILFAVDASGSMAARQRMRAAKGAVLSLLLDAYQRRDKVGMVTFRGAGAEVALPPTSSVEAAARRLTSLATGGRTPLAAGLAQSARVLATERLRDPRRRALLVVVTDGRATSGSDADLARAAALLTGPGLTGPGPNGTRRNRTACVVVDCETSVVRLGLSARLAVMLNAPCFRLDELEAGAGLAAMARQLTRGRAA
ncbi:MAG TPA: magnesium chelatase subunit D family protein [Streptosporangiaceae bacterium]|nr:magnesium chelatase subunit D family protein [Streptosporangiaceae bacterium]